MRRFGEKSVYSPTDCEIKLSLSESNNFSFENFFLSKLYSDILNYFLRIKLFFRERRMARTNPMAFLLPVTALVVRDCRGREAVAEGNEAVRRNPEKPDGTKCRNTHQINYFHIFLTMPKRHFPR